MYTQGHPLPRRDALPISLARHRARLAAVGEQFAREIDVDRLAHRCRGRAREAGDRQPRIGAREAFGTRLLEIEAARRAAAKPHVGIDGVEDRHVDALEPALEHDAVYAAARDARGSAPAEIDQTRVV